MSITVLALGGAWASVLNLLRWLLPRYSTLEQPAVPPLPARINLHPRTAVRPLRVVQWLETGQSPSQVGRLVISGRLADVCAELDRLVERESSRH